MQVVQRLWVLLFLVTVSGAPYASDVTKLAPEPVIVHMQNGFGTEKVIFFKPNDVTVSKVIVTDASGRVGSIPGKDIQVTTEQEADPNLLGVVLQIKTQQFIERGVPYKGVLLIFSQAGKEPKQVPFVVEDDTALSVESLQASLDVSVGVWQPKRYQILVRNNGKTRIDNVSISSSNLTDAVSGKRISLETPNPDWGNAAIEPDGERVVSFDLPQPGMAGTFVGQLYLRANQQKTIAVPLTVRSRGPWARIGLPFALFSIVVIFGFLVSSALDKWFSGGGLARAQAFLSLRNSQTTLLQINANLQDWKTHLPAHTPAIGLPRTEFWLQQAIQELGNELQIIDQTPQDQLTADVQRYAVLIGAASLLWSAVQSAMTKWGNQPDQLQPIIAAMDNVPLPTSAQDFERYRNALLATVPAALAAGPGGVDTIHIIGIATQWNPESVRNKIKKMALLYQAVIWALVVFTAYQSYYAHNLAFGTLSDYMVLFAWSLGLTQTGSQIVARIHK